jgi:hypothetical protein
VIPVGGGAQTPVNLRQVFSEEIDSALESEGDLRSYHFVCSRDAGDVVAKLAEEIHGLTPVVERYNILIEKVQDQSFTF